LKVTCICDTCGIQHDTPDFDRVAGPGSAFTDWLMKHPAGDHQNRFLWRERTLKLAARRYQPLTRIERQHFARRQMKPPEIRPYGKNWLDYLHNADVKTARGASASVSITKASLAASSTLLAGRESDAVTDATNKYLDYMLAGHFKGASSNAQAGSINVAVVGAEDDTPTWQDVFDGSDSTETVSLQNVYDQICKVVATITTTATNSLVWPFGVNSVAAMFGGNIPIQFVLFISHNIETSTNAWSATEGDHAVRYTPVYLTVI